MLPPRLPIRDDLVSFLTSRRRRLRPGDLGLPETGRRRSAGLRREDVAALSGMSLAWYTWLEQGRAVRLSDAMLENLSGALRLDAGERRHLAGLLRRGSPRPGQGTDDRRTDTYRAVIAANPYPAYIKNGRWDVVGWNRPAAVLFGDYARVPEADRNVVRLVFMAASYRSLMVDWIADARDVAARFRADLARRPSDNATDALVAQLLCDSPEFAACWADHDIVTEVTGIKTLAHPLVGAMRFHHARLRGDAPDGDDVVVVQYAPADDESRARADRLFSSGAELIVPLPV